MKKHLPALALLLFWTPFCGAQTIFQHRVNEGRAPSATYLDHPSVNGQPNQVLIVMPVQAQFNDGFLPNLNTSNAEPIIVQYKPEVGRWVIRPENPQGKLIPGMGFNVISLPPNAPGAFTHKVQDGGGDSTTVHNPAIDANKSMVVLVTKASESQIQSTLGAHYDQRSGRWKITNANGKAMVNGEKYHLYGLREGVRSIGGYRAEVQSSWLNLSGAIEERQAFVNGVKSDMSARGAENFFYFATERPDVNANTQRATFINGHPLGVFSGKDSWQYFNRDGAPLPQVMRFNSMKIDISQRSN